MPISLNTVDGEWVAPLAGSVDRNSTDQVEALAQIESLPSRGAWIEMGCTMSNRDNLGTVAPLAGSVDRNGLQVEHIPAIPTSLPSRGAWIEITKVQCPASTQARRRSPRGERG